MEQHEQLVTWLSDAYAMEQSLDMVLARHVAAAREHPEVQQRLQQHRDETRRHEELVAGCLEMLGAKPSAVKALAGGFMGAMQGMSTAVFQDELVKNALADYAMEHFEIACYSSIIAAAEETGQQEIARTCGEILRDEAAMANWLEDHIPAITRLHLQQAAQPH